MLFQLLILAAIFADVLAPFPHDEVNIVDRMQAPSDRYLLGTDQLGRDLLSRLIFGAQISLTVGLAATAVNVVAAVLIGGISGFFGGRLDLAVQRFVDAWMAVPSWGGMLSREGREFMDYKNTTYHTHLVAPRLALWPGLCLTIVVYCLNMFGDAVRDLLDPRLRGGGGRLGAAATPEARPERGRPGQRAPDWVAA